MRSYSGRTPGLYGGRARAGSCDVDRQIRLLTADRGRANAFAGAIGVSPESVPGCLRGLTSAELRADTRVTPYGYSDGRATDRQSVLQAGTAVLVDDRGVRRVRCACGNPLGAPVALRGTPGSSGRAWVGYRPTEVIVVTPAPQVITDITLVDVVDHTWIERRIGHDVRHDKVVPKPQGQPDRPNPSRAQPQVTESGGLPSDGASMAEGGEDAAPALEEPATETATPVVDSDTPLLVPEAGSTAPSLPGEPTLPEPAEPPGPLRRDRPRDRPGDPRPARRRRTHPDDTDAPDAPETADEGIQPKNLS
ncbi:DUF6777 domain-containing protein [Streptomyces sp. TRM70350]|uniref:DUF6777 domain-containing protein n=1 Tax=Streptomyces sp. TRM70350 TaxID=2856165 RepID=UPI001C45BF8A|nr:DUF6777 domain-containing protein [Streptomyces sp. TRM70350]MBV7694491.1 hypothetical protein [Streptomyces sp. TRM70350]